MITRKDIAEYAGVSKTTVTRVINNKGYVSKENLDKINEAIKVLGYQPNLIARSLKTKKTFQILFHAPELSNPFFVEIYKGMDDYAERHGYHIVVSSHYSPNVIIQRQYDGVILSYIPDGYTQEEFIDLKVPAVVTNYSKRHLDIPHINVDIESGMITALDYLHKRGHSQIALVTVPFPDDQRISGYVKWLRKMKLPFKHSLIYSELTGKTNFEQGYNMGLKLADEGIDASAIMVFNDAMAIGMISSLAKKGISIPKDISLVSFDDIPEASFANPPLTTVKTPLYEIGWECAQMLIKRIEGEKLQTKTLKSQLVIRESVADFQE